MKKNLVYAIAMAGQGERFRRAGYVLPKYMIPVAGATLFEHSLRSLPLEPARKLVFIALRSHQERYGLEKFMVSALDRIAGGAAFRPEFELVLLDGPTRGQAETVVKARAAVPAGAELAVYNIDTRFESASLAGKLSGPEKKDGVLGSFKLPVKDEKWSFASLGPDGTVSATAEKKQISDNALTGLYHFTDAQDFFYAAAAALAEGPAQAGEYYVAPLYNTLIAAGRKFVLDEARRMVPLGTPEDVERLDADG
ncbi:MAG: hypothetical protein A2234_11235 [Elusimicrobia bacterium RIFOXYA2_FULL_58_8]|nr:MAG: hypothetical protein A2285_02595 [Elusimicrobia bacterium RIFOXYA12_FULL_57_11]OGS14513.1 MAG: hypothetical protein A2234_11235 [Elusimicrobia bacterium RIFOXYA2_FULL_58_8]